MPRPPAQVLPYFETLGLELTVTFLLTFGGADLSLPADPKGGSEVEAHIGRDNLKALAALSRAPKSAMQARVPLAKRWLTEVLHWQGYLHYGVDQMTATKIKYKQANPRAAHVWLMWPAPSNTLPKLFAMRRRRKTC